MRKVILNPFYWYSFIWSLILVLYSFSWSTLYQALSPDLLLFFLVTIVLSFLLGTLFFKFFVIPEGYKKDINIRSNAPIYIAGVLGLAFVANFLYGHEIPLFAILFHRGSYADFIPIPTFYVLLQTFSIAFIVYCVYVLCYAKSTDKAKWWYLLYAGVPFVNFLLVVNRGAILFTLFASLLVVLSSRSFKWWWHLLFVGVFLLLFVLFGVMGNLRYGFRIFDYTYIRELLVLSPSYPSGLFDAFLWVYAYVVTPLGNLNAYVLSGTYEPSRLMLLVTLLPDFLSKRLFSAFSTEIPLVATYFNVSTGYAVPYKYGGRLGLWFMYGAQLVLVLLVRIFSEKDEKPMLLAFLATFIAYMFFTNIISYSGLSFAIVFPLAYSIYKKIRRVHREKWSL
jgi:hypothetical protein